MCVQRWENLEGFNAPQLYFVNRYRAEKELAMWQAAKWWGKVVIVLGFVSLASLVVSVIAGAVAMGQAKKNDAGA